MALITSAASGNFNAGATWTGGIVPTVGDEARASNGHTITITADATCDEVSNAGTGIFTLNNGVTLTANVTSKSTTTSRTCVQFSAGSPATATIVGNVAGGTVSGAVGVIHSSTGTLNIVGNMLGGSGGSAHACTISSNGTLNATGNVTGGSGSGSYGINQTSNSTINVTGNLTGGSGNAATAITTSNSTNIVTITGNVTGGTNSGSTGFYHWGTGTAIITGIATGGTLGGTTGGGIHNNVGGLVTVKRIVGNAFGPGNSAGLISTPGANQQSSGIIEFEELEYGTFGQSPTNGTGFRLKNVISNKAIFKYVDTGSQRSLVDATTGQMPAATDVRSGVSYASGAIVGSCAVPSPATVATGVPVDNTVGTAALSASDVASAVWQAATSSLTTAGSIGERLKNAATVATTGEQLATALTAP